MSEGKKGEKMRRREGKMKMRGMESGQKKRDREGKTQKQR